MIPIQNEDTLEESKKDKGRKTRGENTFQVFITTHFAGRRVLFSVDTTNITSV